MTGRHRTRRGPAWWVALAALAVAPFLGIAIGAELGPYPSTPPTEAPCR